MLKSIETLLQNLKIIGKINEGGRVRFTQSRLLEIDESYGIFRFLKGDNRTNAIKEIKEIIELAIDKCKDIVNSKYFDEYYNNSENITRLINSEFTKKSELLQIIYTELKNSQNGLSNLKSTYSEDMTIISKIEILMKKIENFTVELEKYIFK